MEKVIEVTYLGGIISDSGTNGKKVESARNKGIGAISTIMSILKDVSLGNHFFEMAVLLRESLFFNIILWNTETWHNFTSKEIEELELIEFELLMKM